MVPLIVCALINPMGRTITGLVESLQAKSGSGN